jgi:hypothetical protein
VRAAVAVRNCAFAGIFYGDFGRCGVQRWCFCGEFVVDCVVNVVHQLSLRWRRKIRQHLGKYFPVHFPAVS